MAKIDERIKAIRARAAALAPDAALTPAEPVTSPSPPEKEVASINAHFGAELGSLVQHRTVQRIPVTQIAPDTRPEMSQPRLLPEPSELMEHGQPVPAYRSLVAELLALGQSLQQQQIQPIVVYPGANPHYPTARYLILVGQRRWTAATLVGLSTLDVIVVEMPSPVDRVRIQYAENEDREEFSDMERAWALLQMKQAMQDAPWEDVEGRLQMSRARRQQLLRLTALTSAQQHHVARLRLQETQIRSMHTGVRNGELSAAQVDAILYRLDQIASERAAAAEIATTGSAPARRVGIDGPTIARLVARAQRTGTPQAVVSTAPTPRWLPPLREQIIRTTQGLNRAKSRLEKLNPNDLSNLLSDIEPLVAVVMELMQHMQEPDDDAASHSESVEA